MGVQGLTQFLKTLPRSAQTTHSRNANRPNATEPTLVVDGNSLAFYVARSVQWARGPDYPRFSALLSKAHSHLSRSEHVLYVFDGGLPVYKHNERMKRYTSKLAVLLKRNIQQTVPEYLNCQLPIFAIQLTIDTLAGLPNATTTIAQVEADDLIAHYSRLYNCPVVSQDSDFYIYNIPLYIPLANILPSLESLESLDDYSQEYIGYNRAQIAKHYCIHLDHLPLLAVLGGADYFESTDLMGMYPFSWCIKRYSDKWPILVKIFKNVFNLSVQEAIDSVLVPFRPDNAKRLRSAFGQSLAQYNCQSFEIQVTEYAGNLGDCTRLHHTLDQVHLTNTFWCMPVPADISRGTRTNLESCWRASAEIRRLIYLFAATGELVTEYDYQGLNIISTLIEIPMSDTYTTIECRKQFYDQTLSTVQLEEHAQYQPLVTAIRQIIKHDANVNDHQVAYWLCAGILSQTWRKSGGGASLVCLHHQAMVECALYSLFLLDQLVLDSVSSAQYSGFVDGDSWQYCFAMARGGAHPRTLVPDYGQFTSLYSHCVSGLKITRVFFYDFDEVGK